jgi:hypothetical protein
MDTNKILEEQRLAKAAKFAQSNAGQTETVKTYLSWGRDQHRLCRESVVTRARWVDERGQTHSAVVPSLNMPIDVPADGLIESNFPSLQRRLKKLTELIAVVEVMLSQLNQNRHFTLPENFRETLDELKAKMPNENVMEVIRGPKPSKK